MICRHRSVGSWLAILAITLQALWPMLVQAKPNLPGLLVPVCTIDGVTHYIDLASGKAPRKLPFDQRTAVHHEHCQLCVFGGERFASLPMASVPVLSIEAVPACLPESASAVAPMLHTYPPAHSRAPPALS